MSTMIDSRAWTCPNGCRSPQSAWWPAPPGGETPPCSNCDAPLVAVDMPWVLESEDNFRGHFADSETGRLPARFYIAAYSVELARGGPEEGGWWYDEGEVIHASYVPSTDDVPALIAALRDEFARVEQRLRPMFGNDDRHNVHGGPDLNVCIQTHWPTDFPAERPHYE